MNTTPLYNFCLNNNPASGTDAKFVSYAYLFYVVIGATNELPADEIRDVIYSELHNFVIDDTDVLEKLYLDHDIAVQFDAVHNGMHGIRILNLN